MDLWGDARNCVVACKKGTLTGLLVQPSLHDLHRVLDSCQLPREAVEYSVLVGALAWSSVAQISGGARDATAGAHRVPVVAEHRGSLFDWITHDQQPLGMV